ncbi:unnamed protein product, partial [Symbiodinium sp. CCMP2456]
MASNGQPVYYRPGSFIAPATGAYAAPGQMMPQPAGAPQPTVRMVPMAPTPAGMPAPLSFSSRTLGQVGVPQALPPGARVIRTSQPAPMPGAPQVMPASA